MAGATGIAADRVREAIEEAVYLGLLSDNLRTGTLLRADAQTQPGSVDVNRVVERATGRFTRLGALRGIEVHAAVPEEPVSIPWHPAMVEQVVSNLLHNAVHHNASGGHVAVVLERHGDRFQLEVIDDGPGVPEEKLAGLRRRYGAHDAGSRSRGGTGLGLSIVGEICARLGWELTFSPEDPHGLCVTVSGPIALDVAAARPSRQTPMGVGRLR
jgi:signal transduction histidine kinase